MNVLEFVIVVMLILLSGVLVVHPTRITVIAQGAK
jgi:hypothetical protein